MIFKPKQTRDMENTYRKWQELQEERTSDLTQANNRQKRIIEEQNIIQKFLHRKVTSRLEGYYLNWNILMEVVDRLTAQEVYTIRLEFGYDKNKVRVKSEGKAEVCYKADNGTAIELLYTSLLKVIEQKKYPFNEGDDYWSIVDGDVVHSCWDDVSEEIYDDNPNRKYFSSETEAIAMATIGKMCGKCNRTNLNCYCEMD